MPEFYVSVDVETDGPCPGINSMLSIGAVALHPDTLDEITPAGRFYSNLQLLPDARPDHDTMSWWRKQGGMYEKTRVDLIDPALAMRALADWLKAISASLSSEESVPMRPVLVAYPAGFDFTFIYYYCHRYLRECPFGVESLDIKSFASGCLDLPLFGTVRGTMPTAWQSPLVHDHHALNDALRQADMFRRMMKWRRERELVLRGNAT